MEVLSLLVLLDTKERLGVQVSVSAQLVEKPEGRHAGSLELQQLEAFLEGACTVEVRTCRDGQG